MTDDTDALEAELRSFRPHEPSPALRRRIGERLAVRPSLRARFALAGALAAACLVIAVVVDRASRRGSNTTSVAPPPTAVRTPPTVQAYRHAWAKSPEALETLLDEQAVTASQVETPPISALTAFHHDFGTWRGDR